MAITSLLEQNRHSKPFKDLTPATETFLLSQLRECGTPKKGRRWTGEEKALFLAMHKRSPKGYRFWQQLFTLPSPKTLQRAVNQIPFNAGLNDAILQHIDQFSKKMTEKNTYCVLLFDEVALRPALSFNKKHRRIEGLEDFGNRRTSRIADHALVFMLRGLNKMWKQPLAYYFVQTSTKAHDLKNIIKTVISCVHEKTSLKILASICDQGSTNLSAMRQLSIESGHGSDFIYKVNGREVIHLFDPPHLLKGVRNALLTKDIHFGNKIAKWSDILQFYQLDGITPDGKICPKLTDQHVNPEGSNKMKVRLATQVFSRSVYAGLTFATTCGALNAEGTAEFVIFMDKLFNSLNGTLKSSKPLNGPVTQKSQHGAFWAEAKLFLNKLSFKKDGRDISPPPSVKNFIATIRNVQALWKIMINLGFTHLLTRCLNQDPLENFFGILRGLCGNNPKPTSPQFVAAFKTACINNFIWNSKATNCEDDGTGLLTMLTHFLGQTNSVPSETISHIPSFSATINPTQVSDNEIKNFANKARLITSSYIAGFLCRKFLKRDCTDCVNYFLSSNRTDSHALIILKDYSGNRLMYPSDTFIEIINRNKRLLFTSLPSLIVNDDIVSVASERLFFRFHSRCEMHTTDMEVFTRKSLIYIITKYFINIVNRKLNNKDKRINKEIDDFIKSFGPKQKF